MVAYLRMPAFRGRQLLAETRLNVLPIGAVEQCIPPATCSTCNLQADDARAHFLFECTPLQAIRDAHNHLPPLLRDCTMALLLRTSVLLHSARAHTKEHATQQEMAYARAVGAFLHDIFHARQLFTSHRPDPSLVPGSRGHRAHLSRAELLVSHMPVTLHQPQDVA